jgi:hypothetical protein
MLNQFRDLQLEEEFPGWGGLEPKAAQVAFHDLTSYLNQPLEVIAKEYWRYRTGEDVVAQ